MTNPYMPTLLIRIDQREPDWHIYDGSYMPNQRVTAVCGCSGIFTGWNPLGEVATLDYMNRYEYGVCFDCVEKWFSPQNKA